MKPGEGRPRRFRISIRVSLSERQSIDEAASRSGITRSAHMRHALFGAKPPRAARKPSAEARLLVSVLDRLGGIASTIRAVACVLNARGNVALPSLMERDLARAMLELRALRPQLLRALGARTDGP